MMNKDQTQPTSPPEGFTRTQAEHWLYRLHRTGRALNAVSDTLLIAGVEIRGVEGVNREDFAALLAVLGDSIKADVRRLDELATKLPRSTTFQERMQ